MLKLEFKRQATNRLDSYETDTQTQRQRQRQRRCYKMQSTLRVIHTLTHTQYSKCLTFLCELLCCAGLCSGLFCSVIVLDVNKIDVKYNKRISKYRDNDDKNGWWMKRNERKSVNEKESARAHIRSHTHERKQTDIQIQYTVNDRNETKGNLTMNNSSGSSNNNNNRNIKIPSLSRLEQWHLFYSAWDDREFAARMTKFKYNNVHDERRNKFTCDASLLNLHCCVF